jgi:hypothetical protein
MGVVPTIFLSVKSAVMWIERLLYGVLRVLTPLGPRYLGPSFLERVYLLWTFRNFTSLPLVVLNHRQQKLVDRLYSQQNFISLAFENGMFDQPLIGTVERLFAQAFPDGNTSRRRAVQAGCFSGLFTLSRRSIPFRRTWKLDQPTG